MVQQIAVIARAKLHTPLRGGEKVPKTDNQNGVTLEVDTRLPRSNC